jgi:hypothetical protein
VIIPTGDFAGSAWSSTAPPRYPWSAAFPRNPGVFGVVGGEPSATS